MDEASRKRNVLKVSNSTTLLTLPSVFVFLGTFVFCLGVIFFFEWKAKKKYAAQQANNGVSNTPGKKKGGFLGALVGRKNKETSSSSPSISASANHRFGHNMIPGRNGSPQSTMSAGNDARRSPSIQKQRQPSSQPPIRTPSPRRSPENSTPSPQSQSQRPSPTPRSQTDLSGRAKSSQG